MEPTLREGDLVAIVRARRIRRGDVVVARRADGLEVIKRVGALPGEAAPDGRPLGEDQYFLAGDNPAESTDSRDLGAFPLERIAGRVAACYWPPGRAGLIRRPGLR